MQCGNKSTPLWRKGWEGADGVRRRAARIDISLTPCVVKRKRSVSQLLILIKKQIYFKSLVFKHQLETPLHPYDVERVTLCNACGLRWKPAVRRCRLNTSG